LQIWQKRERKRWKRRRRRRQRKQMKNTKKKIVVNPFYHRRPVLTDLFENEETVFEDDELMFCL